MVVSSLLVRSLTAGENLRRIEIAEAIDFGSAEKAEVDASALQQAHDRKHVETLSGAADVGRISHGVDELGRWSGADDAILEEADGAGRVSAFGDDEGDERQAHANEDNFPVANLARRGSDHQFAEGEGGGGIGGSGGHLAIGF